MLLMELKDDLSTGLYAPKTGRIYTFVFLCLSFASKFTQFTLPLNLPQVNSNPSLSLSKFSPRPMTQMVPLLRGNSLVRCDLPFLQPISDHGLTCHLYAPTPAASRAATTHHTRASLTTCSRTSCTRPWRTRDSRLNKHGSRTPKQRTCSSPNQNSQ